MLKFEPDRVNTFLHFSMVLRVLLSNLPSSILAPTGYRCPGQWGERWVTGASTRKYNFYSDRGEFRFSILYPLKPARTAHPTLSLAATFSLSLLSIP